MRASTAEDSARWYTKGSWRSELHSGAESLAMRCAGSVGVGMQHVFGSRRHNRLGILTYHRVAEPSDGLEAPSHNVAPRRFAAQLEGLLERGFRFMHLHDVLCERQTRRNWSDVVVVTFDDGFESVFTEAFPVLKALQVPATLLLNTAFVGNQEPFPFDDWGSRWRHLAPPASYRPLTREQCEEMLDSGLLAIGAHTHSHADFRGRVAEFREDMRVNLLLLRDWFGLERPPFAFPFGSPHLGYAGGELTSAVKEMPVSCALTTEATLVEPLEDPFYWGRFNVFSWDSAASLHAKLNGWYSWAGRLRRLVAPPNIVG